MKKFAMLAGAMALTAFVVVPAEAQVRRGAFENAAGGVTAGGQHDLRGPWGGRSVGEGGVVTDGNGNGVGGSRGCAEGAAGGQGCRRGSTSWDNDGNMYHESGAVFEGPLGADGATYGAMTRDEDGDWNGDRTTTVDVGDRTYTADTTFESGEGFDRDVQCSGSGC